MPRLSDLKQDLALESEGAPVLLPCGVTITTGRLGNPASAKFSEKLRAPFKHLLRAQKEIPEDEQRRILVETMAHTVVSGWDLEDDAGEPIPYTPAAAIEVWSDPAYRDFFNEAVEAATTREVFRRAEIEAGAGN